MGSHGLLESSTWVRSQESDLKKVLERSGIAALVTTLQLQYNATKHREAAR